MKSNVEIIERAKGSLFFLEVDNLNFSFDNKLIFQNLSFKISYNRILLIKGCVGSGKTTLLKLIAGIYQNNQNSKNILHQDNKGNDISSIYIHSRPEFNFVTGYIKDEINFSNLEEGDFKNYISKSVYELSGGELKKLSILMALSSRDKVILLDEPLDMLDDIMCKSMSEFIVDKSKESPFIIATHDDYFDDYADVIIKIT